MTQKTIKPLTGKPHICFIATIPAVVHSFLREHILESSKNWSVSIITHPVGAELLHYMPARLIIVSIERKVALWRDLQALFRLVILFRRENFDLVQSIMPKTGLLAMFAALLAGVPNRIHTFTGQVWATKSGWKRSALKLFDRLIVLFATHILVDSPSQRDFLVTEGILPKEKGAVIGRGSICGVDARRFHPDERTRALVRSELGIGAGQTVLLFLGRLNRDKGILDLAAAFVGIASQRSDIVMVLVGAEDDITFARVRALCGKCAANLRRVSFTPTPERYMVAADIFCLPSYREGFGQVIIEAAASGLPSVATRIYGITDAVESGKTGLLFPPGDVTGLTQAILTLIEDRQLRHQMGKAARERSLALFSSQKVTRKTLALYRNLLNRC